MKNLEIKKIFVFSYQEIHISYHCIFISYEIIFLFTLFLYQLNEWIVLKTNPQWITQYLSSTLILGVVSILFYFFFSIILSSFSPFYFIVSIKGCPYPQHINAVTILMIICRNYVLEGDLIPIYYIEAMQQMIRCFTITLKIRILIAFEKDDQH